MDNFLYLLVNAGSISIPLIRSFEPRVDYYGKWKGLFLGIFVMGLVFISWDVAFTAMGVWGFNPDYLTGITLINLPIEEWLFFLAIPYACMFIYEALSYFIKRDILGKVALPIAYVLIGLYLTVGLLNTDKWYTGVTCISTAVFLGYVAFVLKPHWLGRFFVGYFVSLIPFFFVNGILTGSWIKEQIVWYNDAENLGIRIGTIPVEDSVYMLLMLLMVTVIYEWWKSRHLSS